MEKCEIFTAKTFDEIKSMAEMAFSADESEIEFEIIEQPVKRLFGGTKGEFKVKAIFEAPDKIEPAQTQTVSSEMSGFTSDHISADNTNNTELNNKFSDVIIYLSKIITELGAKNFSINTHKDNGNYILDISGEGLGAVIGRRGEVLDSLQYLAILVCNKGGKDGRPRIILDCSGYRKKRSATLESLAERTSAKVIKQGRRITLEPMNPYERRIIHNKVSSIDGVYSNSIGDEPYRKVVISTETPKRRPRNDHPSSSYNNRIRSPRDSSIPREPRENLIKDKPIRQETARRDFARRDPVKREPVRREPVRRDDDVLIKPVPGAVSNAVRSRSYKKSAGFSTSFERDYKRTETEMPEISQDTTDIEKNASLYGRIEL